MELLEIENRLNITEETLSIERVELEREVTLKDSELRQWEDDFKSRELEFTEHEESLKRNFTSVLDSARSDLEKRNGDNLRQLRVDLDTDYQERVSMLETGLHEQYDEQLTRMKDEHHDQVPYYYSF